MRLSIVTGTLDRPAEFERLLRSLELHTTGDWELVVSDASAVPINEQIQLPENVVVIPERPRLGCTKGYNRAFREAIGDWVIWLNDDCEVLPGYAESAIEFMEAHPTIGLGALHYSEDDSPFHVNSAWGATYANFGILEWRVGESVGWFDEDLVMYGNDNSLAFRVLLSGRGIADIPDSRVIHHSTKDSHRADNQANRLRDNDLLASKYLARQHEWLTVFNHHRVATASEPWPHGVPNS